MLSITEPLKGATVAHQMATSLRGEGAGEPSAPARAPESSCVDL